VGVLLGAGGSAGKVGVYSGGRWRLDVNGSGSADPQDMDFSLGWAGATAITGDWNADFKTEVGVYSSGFWFLDYDGNGVWDGGVVDKQIGRIMQSLEQAGLRENTVVLFMSDHGDMMGDHWMLNKGPFHFDGLLRIPLVWSWPKRFGAGVNTQALASQLDQGLQVAQL
jgi:hypothetical protein